MVALIFVIDLPLCSGLAIILNLGAAESLGQRQAQGNIEKPKILVSGV